MRGGGTGDAGDVLAARAVAYAEVAIEGMRLASWDAVEALSVFAIASAELTARRDQYTPAELLVHMQRVAAELAERLAPALDAEVSDQEIVAHAVARAFAVGWQARDEEPTRRGRALGGPRRKATAACDASPRGKGGR